MNNARVVIAGATRIPQDNTLAAIINRALATSANPSLELAGKHASPSEVPANESPGTDVPDATTSNLNSPDVRDLLGEMSALLAHSARVGLRSLTPYAGESAYESSGPLASAHDEIRECDNCCCPCECCSSSIEERDVEPLVCYAGGARLAETGLGALDALAKQDEFETPISMLQLDEESSAPFIRLPTASDSGGRTYPIDRRDPQWFKSEEDLMSASPHDIEQTGYRTMKLIVEQQDRVNEARALVEEGVAKIHLERELAYLEKLEEYLALIRKVIDKRTLPIEADSMSAVIESWTPVPIGPPSYEGRPPYPPPGNKSPFTHKPPLKKKCKALIYLRARGIDGPAIGTVTTKRGESRACHTWLNCRDDCGNYFVLQGHPVGGSGDPIKCDLFDNMWDYTGVNVPWDRRYRDLSQEVRILHTSCDMITKEHPERWNSYGGIVGPNSNTFVAEALRRSGLPIKSPCGAFGWIYYDKHLYNKNNFRSTPGDLESLRWGIKDKLK